MNRLRLEWRLLRYRVPERFWRWLANNVPRKLAYWCAIRVMAHATVGPYSSQVVPELTAMDALQRWDMEAAQ